MITMILSPGSSVFVNPAPAKLRKAAISTIKIGKIAGLEEVAYEVPVGSTYELHSVTVRVLDRSSMSILHLTGRYRLRLTGGVNPDADSLFLNLSLQALS